MKKIIRPIGRNIRRITQKPKAMATKVMPDADTSLEWVSEKKEGARSIFKRSTRRFSHYAVLFIFIIVMIVGIFTRPESSKDDKNPYLFNKVDEQVNEVTYVQTVASIAVIIDESLGRQVYEVTARKNNTATLAVAGDGFVAKPVLSEARSSGDKPKNDVQEYIVKDGDTLSTIANSFSLTTDTLRWANNIDDPDSVKPGTKILIPPTIGVLYTAQVGDTVESIASRFSSSAPMIIAQNDLYGEDIKAGMKIMIPDGVGPEAKKPEPAPAPEESETKVADNSSRGGYGSSSYIGRTGSFGYPTAMGRYHEDGHYGTALDIEGSIGTPIYAADSGQIVEASYGYNGGYGNTILINHGDGFTTRYAHMSSLQIAGGYVSKGQVIGYMGSTGRSTGSHLHFEIMIGGAKQDPLRYF